MVPYSGYIFMHQNLLGRLLKGEVVVPNVSIPHKDKGINGFISSDDINRILPIFPEETNLPEVVSYTATHSLISICLRKSCHYNLLQTPPAFIISS